MQLFLLFLAWVVIAAGVHFGYRRYFAASFLAAAAMVLATQLASYLQTGALDPLWPLSSLVGYFMALVVALITGLPFKLLRDLGDDEASGSGSAD